MLHNSCRSKPTSYPKLDPGNQSVELIRPHFGGLELQVNKAVDMHVDAITEALNRLCSNMIVDRLTNETTTISSFDPANRTSVRLAFIVATLSAIDATTSYLNFGEFSNKQCPTTRDAHLHLIFWLDSPSHARFGGFQ